MSRILIVDDNGQNLYMLEAVLKGAGYEVLQANNGAAALELAEKLAPDLVISDILMPVMDGYELCRRWKAGERYKRIPFIFYTATYTDPRDEKFGLSLGADRFILKPAKIELLQRTVKEVLAESLLGRVRSPEKPPEKNGETMTEYKDVISRKLQDKVTELEWEIAARRNAEELLKKERNKAQNYLDIASVMIVLIDAEEIVQLINKKGCAILGYEEREVLGKNWFLNFLPAKSGEAAQGIFQQLVRGELQSLDSYETPILTKSDEERTILWHNTILKKDSGEFIGVLCAGEDFTERKRMEERLFKLSSALEQSASLVLMTDTKGRIEYVNPKFTEVTGFSLEDLKGRSPGYFKSGETTASEYSKLWGTITAGGSWRGEFHNRKKDGTLYWARAVIAPVRGASGELIAFLGIKEDITAQKALEADLRQAQKMESVGRLAGGVAHDFNNLLTAITGYAGFVLKGLGPDDPERDDVKEILAAADRAGALTKQLLAFSRKQVITPTVFDVNKAVESTAKMLGRLIGEHIRLETFLAPVPCCVQADQGQFGQVLVNLAVNARDAMPDGGALTISTESLEMPAEFFFNKPWLRPGRLVRLSVKDTGTGMTDEVRAHVFEPFFTTKEEGKGTGLGLATVYGVIKQCGGVLELESAPGKGTTFRIYLPEAAGAQEKEGPAAAGNLRGSETVLLVEDEESLRKLDERILQSGGYKVLSCAEGVGAIKTLEEHSGPVDLLVTDVVLPGMNGRELAREAVRRRLCRKVLYISGYANEAILDQGVLESGLAFLEKPFSADALLRKVREVMDETAKVGMA